MCGFSYRVVDSRDDIPSDAAEGSLWFIPWVDDFHHNGLHIVLQTSDGVFPAYVPAQVIQGTPKLRD